MFLQAGGFVQHRAVLDVAQFVDAELLHAGFSPEAARRAERQAYVVIFFHFFLADYLPNQVDAR